MGILRKVTVILELVGAEAGNVVVQGLGPRKARANRPVTGSWSGCCLGEGWWGGVLQIQLL